jgi:hypothetical protein
MRRICVELVRLCTRRTAVANSRGRIPGAQPRISSRTCIRTTDARRRRVAHEYASIRDGVIDRLRLPIPLPLGPKSQSLSSISQCAYCADRCARPAHTAPPHARDAAARSHAKRVRRAGRCRSCREWQNRDRRISSAASASYNIAARSGAAPSLADRRPRSVFRSRCARSSQL